MIVILASLGDTKGDTNDASVGAQAPHDTTHAWAVGYGIIIATSDGGVSWKPQDSGPLTSISAPDATHAWVVGGDGTILSTSDGLKWEPASLLGSH